MCLSLVNTSGEALYGWGLSIQSKSTNVSQHSVFWAFLDEVCASSYSSRNWISTLPSHRVVMTLHSGSRFKENSLLLLLKQ